MSPRERFRADKELVSGFNDLIDSSRMQSAFDAAMLEYQSSLKIAITPEEATANWYRIEGAQKFLLTLKLLNTSVDASKRVDTQKLDYKV
jgi:hypothetical protein